jgi:hypothetical protein
VLRWTADALAEVRLGKGRPAGKRSGAAKRRDGNAKRRTRQITARLVK